MELADVQTNEVEAGVSPADIPAPNEAATDNNGSEKLGLRDQLLKSVETVRAEEATRVRDTATGKFAKKDTVASADNPAAAEIPATEQNVHPTDSKPVGPPSGWSKEAQALWDNLPPAVKADAVRREAEVAKGFDEYRTKTAQLSEISQALEPLRPMLQQHGIQTEAQAVKRLLDWEGSFRNPQTRMQAFHKLAQQYGVDLSTLAQNSSQAPSSVQDIPEPLRPIMDQFGNVTQKVTALEDRLQRADQEKVSETISQFAKDKPHFEKVRVIMGQLMESGIVPPGDLEGAYQKATVLHPEVSAAIRAEEDKKRADELAKTQAEKSRQARLAAASPAQRAPSAPPNGNVPKGKASVRDAILTSVSQLREEQRA